MKYILVVATVLLSAPLTAQETIMLQCDRPASSGDMNCSEFNYVERLKKAAKHGAGVVAAGSGNVGDLCDADADCGGDLVCGTASGCGATPGVKCCIF